MAFRPLLGFGTGRFCPLPFIYTFLCIQIRVRCIASPPSLRSFPPCSGKRIKLDELLVDVFGSLEWRVDYRRNVFFLRLPPAVRCEGIQSRGIKGKASWCRPSADCLRLHEVSGVSGVASCNLSSPRRLCESVVLFKFPFNQWKVPCFCTWYCFVLVPVFCVYTMQDKTRKNREESWMGVGSGLCGTWCRGS